MESQQARLRRWAKELSDVDLSDPNERGEVIDRIAEELRDEASALDEAERIHESAARQPLVTPEGE